MTIYLPSNIAHFASTHETSREIALAIFEIADEGDEERLWRDHSNEEFNAVVKRAWELASEDETDLHWGVENINRADAVR